jgi:tetratricopeptide (TPR) repeat protein
MYSVKKAPTSLTNDLSGVYKTFTAWGAFWLRASTANQNFIANSSHLDLPRRQVWRAYYELLSTIIAEDLVTGTTGALVKFDSGASRESQSVLRRGQHVEFKRVESTYESLLLNETDYPASSERNHEVEELVATVMTNWTTMTSLAWSNADLGDGGKDAVSRGVLDILYRAATKTFHSTPILRHLFTVHASLSEYDLAIHAFDSYAEIVTRGKARADKTGEHEVGLDSDDLAITTAAEAVRILCRFGDRDHADKAIEVASKVESWLHSHELELTKEDLEVRGVPEETEVKVELRIKPATLAAAYRTIAITKAQSAHLTFEKSDRLDHLQTAEKYLQRALKFDPVNVQTAHALALVLSEQHDVTGAIKLIKSTIAAEQASSKSIGSTSNQTTKIARSIQMVPLWHLLALCLTAKDEFEAASQVCDTAFEQFGNLSAIFGANGTVAKDKTANLGSSELLESLTSFEKESLVQVQITKLVLIELMEGPDEAVNSTDELLSLYSRLFGSPRFDTAAPANLAPTRAQSVSIKKGSTLRSITGSIRPKSVRSVRLSSEKEAPSTEGAPPMPGASIGAPIEITVTNEDGQASKKEGHHHLHLPHLPKLHKDANKDSATVTGETSSSTTLGPVPAAVKQSAAANPSQPLREIAHNGTHDDLPPPPGHDEQPPFQDKRLPVPQPGSGPSTSISPDVAYQERRHQTSLLVKIWLFVAGVYVRAQSFDDALSAIEDAKKWVEALEADLAATRDGTSARKLFEKGWGGGKSVDAIWADWWSAVSHGLILYPNHRIWMLTNLQKAQLATSQESPFVAMAAYEEALAYYPDHPAATVGIANLLMDIYEEKIPSEEPLLPLHPFPLPSGSTLVSEARPALTRPNSSSAAGTSSRPISQHNIVTLSQSSAIDALQEQQDIVGSKLSRHDPSPAELNRLAARERAYILLKNLSRSGAGWDDSEAWYALARAHELSREIGKAKSALWWVVELEECRPVRDWREVSPGGYTL